MTHNYQSYILFFGLNTIKYGGKDMATFDTCTKPEEGWSLIGHFLGNILKPIQLTVTDKKEGWQAEVARLRMELLERLQKIVTRMKEHGHAEEAEKMNQVCAMVEGNDLNSLDAIQAVFAKEKEISPTSRAMDEVLKRLFGGAGGTRLAQPFPVSKGLDDGTYYFRTDLVQQAGNVPTCCDESMVAEDDHGRFRCFKCGQTVAV